MIWHAHALISFNVSFNSSFHVRPAAVEAGSAAAAAVCCSHMRHRLVGAVVRAILRAQNGGNSQSREKWREGRTANQREDLHLTYPLCRKEVDGGGQTRSKRERVPQSSGKKKKFVKKRGRERKRKTFSVPKIKKKIIKREWSLSSFFYRCVPFVRARQSCTHATGGSWPPHSFFREASHTEIGSGPNSVFS